MFSALKERYAGKIDAHVGGSEAYRHIGLVSRLFQEWNPVGHPAEQVKALLGEPTSEKDGYLEYRFDSGLNGIIWRFHVGDGRVTEIEKIPLE